MKRPEPMPEQRAALERAKRQPSPFKTWHGKTVNKPVELEKVVPAHARLVRR